MTGGIAAALALAAGAAGCAHTRSAPGTAEPIGDEAMAPLARQHHGWIHHVSVNLRATRARSDPRLEHQPGGKSAR